jgi:uncharacterized protein
MDSKMQGYWRIAWPGLVITVSLLGGCFSLSRTEPPMRHYVLGGSIPTATTAPPAALTGVTVGIRRARIAGYLGSPYIAVRHGAHQVTYSEFHRWGEPLDGGLNRTVAGYLDIRPEIGGVDVAPWPGQASYDYLLQLHLERFEGRAPAEEPTGQSVGEGEVHVLVTWEILRQQGGGILARGVTEYREPGWTVGDYASLVRALDAGVGALAGDVAASLANLQRGAESAAAGSAGLP